MDSSVSQQPASAPSFPIRRFLAVLLLALVARSGALWLGFDRLRDDPDSYRLLAETWRRTGVYGMPLGQPIDGERTRPTAFRPPLYPLLLAALAADDRVSAPAVAALHLVLGIATAALTWAIAERLALGRWSALAGLLVAVDPILLNQSTLVMTETAATFLASLAWLALALYQAKPAWMRAAAAGAAMMLAALCRPTFLPWLGLSGIAFLVMRLDSAAAPVGLGMRVRHGAAFALAAALVAAPWALRNAGHFGRPILSTTHGGYTLHLGNNRFYYRHLRQGKDEVWDARELQKSWPAATDAPSARDPRSELFEDRRHYEAARQAMREDRPMLIHSSLTRIADLWRLVPHRLDPAESGVRRGARWLVGAWHAAVFLLAAMGVFARRRQLLQPAWLGGLLLCAALTATHALYWSNLRMRAPAVPVICVCAAAGASWLAAQRRR